MQKAAPGWSFVLASLKVGFIMKRFAQKAYINGKVYTVDEDFRVVSAFCVTGDRFLATGSDADIAEYCDNETEIIDLNGAVVLPGLIDSHLHVTGTGALKLNLDLAGKTKNQIIALVAEARTKTAPGGWITGSGWLQSDWGSSEFPTKAELDAVCPDLPVYLSRACGHASWANSLAFELAGVTADMPDPKGGEIVRTAEGDLLGVVTDNAQDRFNKIIPGYDKAQLQQTVLLAQEGFFAAGLTTVHDAGTADEYIEAWTPLYESGALKLRIYAMMRPMGRPTYDELFEESMDFFKKGLRIGLFDNRLTARAYKISGDGSLGARSAWMLEGYSDRPGFTSDGKWTDEQLYDIFYAARKSGFQIMYHAIGDAANRQALDIYERVIGELPSTDHRLRIEHAQILSQSDIPRFPKLGVIPTHQTVFLRSDKEVADARLGAERMKGAYAWRTLIDGGSIVPNGTDSPVEPFNPFLAMHCAVTRTDEQGRPEGGWYIHEAMTREEALKSYTIWGAYAGFEEHLKGSIEVGKLADFIIIDRDMMVCAASDIQDTQVLETVLGGETVYRR